jgi:hypothetical protein
MSLCECCVAFIPKLLRGTQTKFCGFYKIEFNQKQVLFRNYQ